MSAYREVRATTASAMTAEQWEAAWKKAAPVVVAANRFIEAEADGTPALVEDAHFQLLRALTKYKASPPPGAERQHQYRPEGEGK